MDTSTEAPEEIRTGIVITLSKDRDIRRPVHQASLGKDVDDDDLEPSQRFDVPARGLTLEKITADRGTDRPEAPVPPLDADEPRGAKTTKKLPGCCVFVDLLYLIEGVLVIRAEERVTDTAAIGARFWL